MAGHEQDPVARYEALLDQVEGRFAAIQQRNSSCMECRSGCSDCCRSRLSVTHLEQAHMRREIARLPAETRADLARQATDERREMCPALDAAGRCRIYSARPLICRSHGVPLRQRYAEPLVRPDVIDVCDKNFRGAALKMLPAEDVLDQTSLTQALGEINSAHCADHGLATDDRIPIAAILRECGDGQGQANDATAIDGSRDAVNPEKGTS